MSHASGGPFVAGVVIPAHNEEAVVGRLLSSLLDGPNPLEVVVVCNGCTDGTASLARQFEPAVQVLETSVPSKAKALKLGDLHVGTFPRIYLDADVELDNTGATELVRALAGPVLAAGPRRVIPLEGTSPLVRTYYRTWQQLPHVCDGLWGRGVIVLSDTGHARVLRLMDVMSDDLAISLLFEPHERTVVDSVPVIIHPPRTLRALLARRRRGVTGNTALVQGGTSLDESRTRLADLLFLVRSSPHNVPGVCLIFAMATAARLAAWWAGRRGTSLRWARDETSRRAPRLDL